MMKDEEGEDGPAPNVVGLDEVARPEQIGDQTKGWCGRSRRGTKRGADAAQCAPGDRSQAPCQALQHCSSMPVLHRRNKLVIQQNLSNASADGEVASGNFRGALDLLC
jgi:hypothetical protein